MDEKNPIDEKYVEKNENISQHENDISSDEAISSNLEDGFIKKEIPSESVDNFNENTGATDINNATMPNPADYGWHPAAPQYPFPNGYYNPQQIPQYNMPPMPYPPYLQRQPKRKMNAGTKAIFWIIGALIGLFVVTTSVYGTYRIINTMPEPPNSQNNPFFPFDNDKDIPSKNDENSFSDNNEDYISDLPEITPNTNGIKINPLPKNKDEFSAKEIYSSIKNSIVGVVVETNGEIVSQGSGIIATKDGYIITNAHVVLNRRNVKIRIFMNDESEYRAAVVGFDKTTDLAVLKIYDTENTFIPVNLGDSNELSVGDWVLAIGNPGGQDFAGSLTRGIVSAVDRKVGSNSSSGMTYIQTDAAINPGNSGGPLVNMYGQVIGINSSKIVANGYEGMGFSIPITKAKSIIDELMATGYVQGRTRLGITGIDVSAYYISIYDLPHGFQIASIAENSAFANVDAQVGDIIIEIDGETVTGLVDITAVLASHGVGDKLSVVLYRYGNGYNSETVNVEIYLLEDKGETQQ